MGIAAPSIARASVPLCLVTALAMLITGCFGGASRIPVSDNTPSIWPVQHAKRSISSGYGESRGRRAHQGIDIAAPKGAPVVATASGRVVVSRRDRGYGKHVIVDHGNGYRTVYAHLSERKVKVGARVKAGTVIGKVGKSGRASGPHLHYEIRRNGAPVNPRPFLGR